MSDEFYISVYDVLVYYIVLLLIPLWISYTITVSVEYN